MIETDNAGAYCTDCLFRLIADGDLEVYESGWTNCESCGDSSAMYCESCASNGGCANCGDEASFCSADCAIAYGNDPEDYHSSCVWCGDDAYYCSVRCAFRDTGETICTNCESEYEEALCSECIDDVHEPPAKILTQDHTITFRVLPQQVVAAEPMVGVDETSVTMDGITFEFE